MVQHSVTLKPHHILCPSHDSHGAAVLHLYHHRTPLLYSHNAPAPQHCTCNTAAKMCLYHHTITHRIEPAALHSITVLSRHDNIYCESVPRPTPHPAALCLLFSSISRALLLYPNSMCPGHISGFTAGSAGEGMSSSVLLQFADSA